MTTVYTEQGQLDVPMSEEEIAKAWQEHVEKFRQELAAKGISLGYGRDKLVGQLPLTKREIAAKRRREKAAAEWWRRRKKRFEREEKQFPHGEFHTWDKGNSLSITLDGGDPDVVRATLHMPGEKLAFVSLPLPRPDELVEFIHALVVRYNHAVAQMNATAAKCVVAKPGNGDGQ